jgi:hypothetical protein
VCSTQGTSQQRENENTTEIDVCWSSWTSWFRRHKNFSSDTQQDEVLFLLVIKLVIRVRADLCPHCSILNNTCFTVEKWRKGLARCVYLVPGTFCYPAEGKAFYDATDSSIIIIIIIIIIMLNITFNFEYFALKYANVN